MGKIWNQLTYSILLVSRSTKNSSTAADFILVHTETKLTCLKKTVKFWIFPHFKNHNKTFKHYTNVGRYQFQTLSQKNRWVELWLFHEIFKLTRSCHIPERRRPSHYYKTASKEQAESSRPVGRIFRKKFWIAIFQFFQKVVNIMISDLRPVSN